MTSSEREPVPAPAATVGDVMHRGVSPVTAATTYKGVVTALSSQQLRAMPVVDPRGVVVGMVSDGDLLAPAAKWVGRHRDRSSRAGRRADRRPAALVAGQVMTSPAVTVTPDVPIAGAARIVEERDVRQLPVVDGDGVLLGLVTRADLLRQYERPDEAIGEDVRTRVVAGMFSLEPETVEVRVADGVVTLTGQLEDAAIERAFVEAVGAAPGVVAVDDRLTSVAPPRARHAAVKF